jgi:hypothetical protein
LLTEKQAIAALAKWDRKTKHLIRFVLDHGISYEKLDISFSNYHWEIAKFIVDEVMHGEILFYVPEYGVWPGPNAYETFHFVRDANGRSGSVRDYPAEVLYAGSAYARSVVHTAIVSDWDVCLVCMDPDCMWYWSHENWLRFITEDRDQEQLVRDRFGMPRNEWDDPGKGLEDGSRY